MNNQTIKRAVTSMKIQANKADVWEKVGFYEHVQKQPTWLLRLSLPVPCEVQGSHAEVGDTCRCRYSDGGYLTKRITRVIDQSRIEFEIIEQSIRYQDTVKLLGGHIEVKDDGEGQSIVNMVTFYENRIPLKRISTFFIDKVIKTMHRFVIEDMRGHLAGRVAASNSPASC